MNPTTMTTDETEEMVVREVRDAETDIVWFQRALARTRKERDERIRDLAQRHSLREVAAMTDLSFQRVHQIVHSQ